MADFPPDVPFGCGSAARWPPPRTVAGTAAFRRLTGAMPATAATDGGERLIQMRLEMLLVVRESLRCASCADL